jgi:hypothetical protein
MTPTPEEAKGVMFVATEKPIPVGVEGTTVITTKNVAGYYLVHKDDMKVMIDTIRKYEEMQKGLKHGR